MATDNFTTNNDNTPSNENNPNTQGEASTRVDNTSDHSNNEKKQNRKADFSLFGHKPYVTVEGEEYMTGGQPAHFKRILESWKKQLMEEVDRTVHHMQDESANLPDPADRATQEEEFSLELRARDRERKLIKKIEKTLKKLEEHDYGYCEACGIEIGIRRLEARPTASLCIDCKTLDEIKEKQTRG